MMQVNPIQPAPLLAQSGPAAAPEPLTNLPTGIPALLTCAEVEAIFNRSARALRDWARNGRLRRVKVGHSVFYLAEDVRRLVAEGLSQAVLDRAGKLRHRRNGTPL